MAARAWGILEHQVAVRIPDDPRCTWHLRAQAVRVESAQLANFAPDLVVDLRLHSCHWRALAWLLWIGLLSAFLRLLDRFASSFIRLDRVLSNFRVRSDCICRLFSWAYTAAWAINIRIDIPIVPTRLALDVNRIVYRQFSVKIGVGVRRGEFLTIDGYIVGVRRVPLE